MCDVLVVMCVKCEMRISTSGTSVWCLVIFASALLLLLFPSFPFLSETDVIDGSSHISRSDLYLCINRSRLFHYTVRFRIVFIYRQRMMHSPLRSTIGMKRAAVYALAILIVVVSTQQQACLSLRVA